MRNNYLLFKTLVFVRAAELMMAPAGERQSRGTPGPGAHALADSTFVQHTLTLAAFLEPPASYGSDLEEEGGKEQEPLVLPENRVNMVGRRALTSVTQESFIHSCTESWFSLQARGIRETGYGDIHSSMHCRGGFALHTGC